MIDPTSYDWAGKNTTRAQISRDLDKFIWAAVGVVAMLVITIAFFWNH